jgi:hypothetical protein
MKRVKLTQGYVALVSNEDYARVMRHKWHALVRPRNVYAVRLIRGVNGKQTSLLLHRFILALEDSAVKVDHFPDPSGLNCQRNNLRQCTFKQNIWNQRLRSNNTSGYKGVTFQNGRWRAEAGGRGGYIGMFGTAIAAARAYDKRALELFGNFANLNFKRRSQ